VVRWRQEARELLEAIDAIVYEFSAGVRTAWMPRGAK